MTITYLTGVTNEFAEAAAAKRDDLGLLGTPAGGTWTRRAEYGAYAADNGCFVDVLKPGSFDADAWLAWLETTAAYPSLWATLPDVVGDAVATWERSKPFVAQVRELGYAPAVCMQNGLENEPEVWAEMLASVDVVFIGGTPECIPCGYVGPAIGGPKTCPTCNAKVTEWKLGAACAALVAEALAAGKRVHMGRVNSAKRLRYAASIGCHTADGTFLKFCARADREAQVARLVSMLEAVNG